MAAKQQPKWQQHSDVSTHSHPKVAAAVIALTSNTSTLFQHTATRRWLPDTAETAAGGRGFNTQPPEGGCDGKTYMLVLSNVSTHSHPKVAAIASSRAICAQDVSTHSHPKVAATSSASFTAIPSWFQHTATRRWLRVSWVDGYFLRMFQHTATRRWLQNRRDGARRQPTVSTHSHPKVAAKASAQGNRIIYVSTHSPPKVAARGAHQARRRNRRFNTQPPEGGCAMLHAGRLHGREFQHTATRRWLRVGLRIFFLLPMFQHTATRRWLLKTRKGRFASCGFNTQPPEGGCKRPRWLIDSWRSFNTQPPEGGCRRSTTHPSKRKVSTHSHPKVAASGQQGARQPALVSTHSHPKVAACPAVKCFPF